MKSSAESEAERYTAVAADHLHALVDAMTEGIISADEQGEIVSWNAAAKALFGYGADAPPRGSLAALIPGCLDPPSAGPHVASAERTARRADGTEFVAEVATSPMTFEGARFTVATIRDVTRRREAEDARRTSEERYRRIIETTHEGVCIADADYRFTFVNGRLSEMLGYEPNELLGMSVFDLMDEVGGVAQRERMVRRRAGLPESGELALERKDGREVWVMFESHSIYEDGEYKGVLSMMMDISERRRMEAHLRQSESQLHEAQHAARMGSWEWDLSTNVVTRSPEYDRMLEIDSPANAPAAFEAVHPDDRARVRARMDAAIRDRTPWSTEHRLVVPSGVLTVQAHGNVIVDEKGAPLRVVGTVQDITEKKSAEARIALSGRLASLGTLALGLAHEINNPLAVVTTSLDLIGEEARQLMAASPSTRLIGDLVHDAREAADRVREIVRGMKTFSRGDEEAPLPIDLRRMLDVAIDLTRREVRPHARLETHYGDVPIVIAPEARLGQVLIHLLVNAVQSFQGGDSETNEIRVVTRTGADGHAVVEIRDNGRGIPDEVIGRIFDPFFTMKDVGDGPGLGLSVCHGIVAALGGELTVTSELGAGSVFTVVLPAAAHERNIQPAPRTSAKPDSELRARVLVVDDDVMMAKTIGRVLRDHQTTFVMNGREALDLLLAGTVFDVILCDLVMPVMSGMELHAQLAERLPEALETMIFVTGGAFTVATQAFLDRVPNECIAKPFDQRGLRAAVQRAVRPRTMRP